MFLLGSEPFSGPLWTAVDVARFRAGEWSIDVDESFRGRVVDEDLQLVSVGPPVRTIWIAIWSPPPDLAPAEVLNEILLDVRPRPQLRFREHRPIEQPAALSAA
jgi:hypothetical protein